MVEAWLDRLRAEGLRAFPISSAHEALLIEESSHRDPGVYVATISRLSHGPSARLIQESHYNLVLLDEPPRSGRIFEAVESVIGHADRSVALLSSRTSSHDLAWSPSALIAKVTFDEAIASGEIRFDDVTFVIEEEERQLLEAAATLVRRPQAPQALASQDPVSRPLLHSALLHVTEGPANGVVGGEEEPLSREASERSLAAWRLLEQLEDLGPDPRLLALDAPLAEARSAGRGSVVVTSTPIEAEYVHSVSCFLKGHGRLSGDWSDTTRRQASRVAWHLSGPSVGWDRRHSRAFRKHPHKFQLHLVAECIDGASGAKGVSPRARSGRASTPRSRAVTEARRVALCYHPAAAASEV